MNRRYASETTVSVSRSKAEIEELVRAHGAKSFASGWDPVEAIIQFELDGKSILFRVQLPKRDAPEITQTPTGRRKRNGAAIDKAWEQAQRQRWRALQLVIKAKLEAVETGITTLEQEFLAHMVTRDGRTVGECLLPELDKALQAGPVRLLPPGG